jgi:chromosome segregation ATPase
MEEQINESLELEAISKALVSISNYLENEIKHKQHFIEKLESEAETLRKTISAKDTEITGLQEKLQEILQSSEGNRQIINKLLNDISHYQKDIDWYKRTYEKRSLLGTIREKLFRRH